jgi:MFS family permease
MGRFQSASAIGRVIGPLICGPLYMYVGLNAPFFTGAAIMLPVLLLLWQFRLAQKPAADESAAKADATGAD